MCVGYFILNCSVVYIVLLLDLQCFQLLSLWFFSPSNIFTFLFCSLFSCHIIAIFLYSAIALPYIFNSCFHFVCICLCFLLIIIIDEWNKLELKHLTNDNNINTANTLIFLYKNLIPFMIIPHLFLDWHSVNCALSMFIVLVLSFCLLLLFSVSTNSMSNLIYVYLNFIFQTPTTTISTIVIAWWVCMWKENL